MAVPLVPLGESLGLEVTSIDLGLAPSDTEDAGSCLSATAVASTCEGWRSFETAVVPSSSSMYLPGGR